MGYALCTLAVKRLGYMKIGIGIIVVLIVLAGGYYLMTKQPAPATEPVEESAMNETTDETSADTAPAAGDVREFVVEGGMFYFTPKTMEVNEGDTVRITFKNVEGRHDWTIDEFDARTAVLGANEEETIEFVANRAGEFEYYCSVGNHRAMGMVGTLIVN